MIIYYDHRCGKLIYRVSINGQPEEFLSMGDAIDAMAAARASAVLALYGLTGEIH